MHPKQIPTTYTTINKEMFHKGIHIIELIARCLCCDMTSPEYKNCITMAAVLIEQISCMLYDVETVDSEYGCSACYHKPLTGRYRKNIFEAWAETTEEVSDRIPESFREVIDAGYVYKIIWQIADLVCRMMADETEQATVGEYAYALDYVVKHKGELEEPDVRSLFPRNYEDFRYWEGICEEISDYYSW